MDDQDRKPERTDDAAACPSRRRLLHWAGAGGAVLAANALNGGAAQTPPRADAARAPGAPRLVLSAKVLLGEPFAIGATPGGFRRIIPIAGGTFEGSGVRGEVLPFGADWQMIRESGQIDLDARYLLKTDHGDLISVVNVGQRYVSREDAARIVAGQPVDQSHARGTGAARFETSAPGLAWLNYRTLQPAGRRLPTHIELNFFDLADGA